MVESDGDTISASVYETPSHCCHPISNSILIDDAGFGNISLDIMGPEFQRIRMKSFAEDINFLGSLNLNVCEGIFTAAMI